MSTFLGVYRYKPIILAVIIAVGMQGLKVMTVLQLEVTEMLLHLKLNRLNSYIFQRFFSLYNISPFVLMRK